MLDWVQVYDKLRRRIELFGVKVESRPLGFETTGVFDGLSITTNTAYDLETRCHNIAHSLGHIVQWSLDYSRHATLYTELYAAKAQKPSDPAGLEQALLRFRDYEEEASEYAAWLLIDTGNAEALPAFTLFARADIEAIVGFHRDGMAPLWKDYFAGWQSRLTGGQMLLQPFAPRPIPPFTPRAIEPQEVIQEVDGLQ